MIESYEDRRYVIFDVSELPQINFEEVFETSMETVRLSVDGTKTFVKFNLPQPPTVQSLTTKSIEYTHEEMLDILATPEWSDPSPFG